MIRRQLVGSILVLTLSAPIVAVLDAQRGPGHGLLGVEFGEEAFRGDAFDFTIENSARRWATGYDFPAAHWQHLRTTNPIESSFATIRHRARQTKGCGSRAAILPA